jgi:hypothetical protein
VEKRREMIENCVKKGDGSTWEWRGEERNDGKLCKRGTRSQTLLCRIRKQVFHHLAMNSVVFLCHSSLYLNWVKPAVQPVEPIKP